MSRVYISKPGSGSLFIEDSNQEMLTAWASLGYVPVVTVESEAQEPQPEAPKPQARKTPVKPAVKKATPTPKKG